MHLSDLECQQKILGAIGDWKDDREIDEIFTLIDRQRHAASERQIFSYDAWVDRLGKLMLYSLLAIKI